MKKQILIIHGGDAFETYEEYIASLQTWEVTLQGLLKVSWKKSLNGLLGDEYQVLTPQMPNAVNARYKEWKIYFEKIIPVLNDEVILLGHSLGGIFLTKYLSENQLPKKVLATILIAAPYNTKNHNPYVDFNISDDLSKLQKQSMKTILYHSKDDSVVSFKDFEKYQKALPHAEVRIFEDKGHFNAEQFPELIEELKNI